MTPLRRSALVFGATAVVLVGASTHSVAAAQGDVTVSPAVSLEPSETYETAIYAAASNVQECNDHMQAPWVALYEHINFQGDSICVMGTGLYNLNGIGWANRISSVNIGAEGYVADGSPGAYNAGRYMSYHYGTQIADLRTVGWNDRFQILRTSR